MMLQILIPTYNRGADLEKNLRELAEQIDQYSLADQVGILVSDNHSPDDTPQRVAQFQQEFPNISLAYHRQPENIGLEPNSVFCLQAATAPYILWLGDDDFIDPGYLPFVLEQLAKNPSLGCIITGILAIWDHEEVVDQRVEAFETKALPKGYDTALKYSHLGHQLSGLVLIREGLLEDYLATPEYRNMYLFLYFVCNRLLRYEGLYAPKYKTRVALFNTKAWDYNKVGLLDEVFRCYFGFRQELSTKQVGDLILKFCVLHSYRIKFPLLQPWRVEQQFKVLKRTADELPGLTSRVRKWIWREYLAAWKATLFFKRSRNRFHKVNGL